MANNSAVPCFTRVLKASNEQIGNERMRCVATDR